MYLPCASTITTLFAKVTLVIHLVDQFLLIQIQLIHFHWDVQGVDLSSLKKNTGI